MLDSVHWLKQKGEKGFMYWKLVGGNSGNSISELNSDIEIGSLVSTVFIHITSFMLSGNPSYLLRPPAHVSSSLCVISSRGQGTLFSLLHQWLPTDAFHQVLLWLFRA